MVLGLEGILEQRLPELGGSLLSLFSDQETRLERLKDLSPEASKK